MNHKQTLAIILILALFLRIIDALIIPIFEKPDEKAHFEYIKFISDNKKLPVQQQGQRSAEFFQPPFYHFIASFLLSFIKIFTQDISYQVYLFRIISDLISIITLYVIYKIAFLIFNDKTLSLGVLIFASFLPSHINMNSNVTNSNFGDLLSVFIIYLLLIILMKEKKQKIILLLGLIAGISLITRFSVIPAIITIPFAFILKYYTDIRKVIKPIALICIIALLIASWHFIRNFMLYGDPLGINAVKLSSPKDEIKLDFIFAARLVGWTFITFWASFGRTNGAFIGNLTSSIGIVIFILSYLLFLIFTFSSIYGLYIFLKKYRKNKNILSSNQRKAFMILVFHLIILSLLFLSFNFYDFQPQGRLFFPAMPALAIFFTLGIYNLFKSNNINKFLQTYFIIFILINIASIISITINF